MTSLFVIGIATQGLLVEFHRLAILLAAIGNVTQVIAGLAAQLLVLGTLCQVGEQAFGLLHRVLIIILLRCDATLTHKCSGEVELSLFAGRIGL